MPTVRLLRTTLGSYDVFNLTSAILLDFVRHEDLSASIVLGTEVLFTTAVPYAAGSLELILNGVLQNGTGFFTESNPALGQFTITVAQPVGTILFVRYVQA